MTAATRLPIRENIEASCGSYYKILGTASSTTFIPSFSHHSDGRINLPNSHVKLRNCLENIMMNS